MSDIKFYCTSCGKKLAIDVKAAGLMVDCPQCGKRLKIPSESDERLALPPEPAAPPSLSETTALPHRPIPASKPAPSPVLPPPVPPAPRPAVPDPELTVWKQRAEKLDAVNKDLSIRKTVLEKAKTDLEHERDGFKAKLEQAEAAAARHRDEAARVAEAKLGAFVWRVITSEPPPAPLMSKMPVVP